jgi:LmbE family N-acetylglucosaminyl deacetylase
LESMYPDLVRKVLFVIYDYGYVHAEHEPACAAASKIWADALLEKLGKQIEAHGLPHSATGPGVDDRRRRGVRGCVLHLAPKRVAGAL